MRGTKASPPLPSHDGSGTPLLSRKSHLSEVREWQQGRERARGREELLGDFCFENPTALKN